MARERLIKKDASRWDEGICTFIAQKDGLTVKEGDMQEINVNTLTDEIQKRAKVHGVSQKVGDNFAGAAGDVDKAWQLCAEMIDQLKEGLWKDREAGEGGMRTSLLVEAVAQIKGISVEEARAKLFADQPEDLEDDATEDEKKAHAAKAEAFVAKITELRKHPVVKKKVLEIQMARETAAAAAEGVRDVAELIG